MLKKIILLFAIVSIVYLYMGCSSKNNSDLPESYTRVLQKIHEAEKNKIYDDIYYPQENFRMLDDKAYYALYDIDNNGILELFIGNGEINMIWALKDNEPVKLPECSFGQRNRGWLLKKGIILNVGAGSSSSHIYNIYKMSANGYSVELEDSFLVESSNSQDGTILDITQTNETDSKKITKDEFNTIMKSYIGTIAFPFDSGQLDVATLNWKSVESCFSNE